MSDLDEQEEAFPYTTIGTDNAKSMIEQGVRIIDVRQPEEWQSGHIAEATLVPINSIYAFGNALKELHLPEDEEVIFVCRSGQRSATACEIAMVAGLKKVYNLANGMIGWGNKGYPTTR